MLNYTMQRIDGSEEDLAGYQGNVLMLVNVASRCGLTPQYAALQELYDRYRERGFEILGFPANNFREQEPGTDEEIAEFCDTNYNVSFPFFSKISVGGDDIHPLYAELTGMPDPIGGEVQWNFQKYLVDRSGNVVEKISSRTAPDDEAVVARIEELLGAG